MTDTTSPDTPPVLFLDFDDVICLNRPYGGYDVLTTLAEAERRKEPLQATDELWSRLFDLNASVHLKQIHIEFTPQYVLSTSWRWFFDHENLVQTLRLTGLDFVAGHLHHDWSTPQISRQAHRAVEIKGWLNAHPEHKNAWVVLDDELSGTGFATWPHASRRFVVLCQEGVGLQKEELRMLRNALSIRAQGMAR